MVAFPLRDRPTFAMKRPLREAMSKGGFRCEVPGADMPRQDCQLPVARPTSKDCFCSERTLWQRSIAHDKASRVTNLRAIVKARQAQGQPIASMQEALASLPCLGRSEAIAIASCVCSSLDRLVVAWWPAGIGARLQAATCASRWLSALAPTHQVGSRSGMSASPWWVMVLSSLSAYSGSVA